MLDSKRKKDLIKRLKYIKGQVAAIEKMIDENREAHDIFVQLRSVESAFGSSIMGTFDREHRRELAEQIVTELENCPGSCGYCELVVTLRRDFPKLTLTQVFDGLHQIKKRQRK